MSEYNPDRPYIRVQDMATFKAIDTETASMYGRTVRAAEISNVDYKMHFTRFHETSSMKPPPSCGRIFMGYVVVRKLGRPDQYETWMPDHVFEELYGQPVSTPET
ncbi:hypothetical protein I6J77_17275 [Rhodanobacter sp. FDAARGOS 1247]|uniref:hypothetical protein n=1 Tax=Rhodanobacter sp. FDAARGOS 1247 TaxID=2778082 RepID=UPI001952713F|nr:hypothetical protein [Rhodanobacter sp. FDAARGOS 1247]QRP63819.1 hypothetical protein I6J77_17275 [Rhodanobacter sp. FDAARGOS 1247]